EPPFPDGVTQKTVAGAEQKLDLADIDEGTAHPVLAMATRALFGEDPAATGQVALERRFIELGVRAFVPSPQEGDDGLDIGAGKRTTAQDRPRRHGRAAAPVVDGLAEKVVTHRGEKRGVGDGRCLIGFVTRAARSMANGAHLSVKLSAAALDARARNSVAARGCQGKGEKTDPEKERKTAHVGENGVARELRTTCIGSVAESDERATASAPPCSPMARGRPSGRIPRARHRTGASVRGAKRCPMRRFLPFAVALSLLLSLPSCRSAPTAGGAGG